MINSYYILERIVYFYTWVYFMKRRTFFLILLIIFAIILGGIGYKRFYSNNSNFVSSENISQDNSNSEDSDLTVKTTKKEDITINMSVIGDIMCHNSQYIDAFSGSTYDFSYVFSDIKHYIDNADIAIGNLETTFAGAARGYSNYPTFNTPEQLAQNLKDFGIDVVSTANNHCMDTGYKGLVSTLDYLDSAGISHTGTSRTQEEQNTVLIKDINGIKIAFLSFTYGTNGIPVSSERAYSVNLISDELILNQLQLAKAQNPDLICVSMHWGIEYQNTQNKEQERLADLLFQNGTDIILGSHPHVLQPMEKRTITLEDGSTKDGFVIYSLGNFMSGQTKERTRNSIILNIELTKNGETDKISIGNISYVPIYMYKNTSKTTQKYLVLDIENAIKQYDSGNHIINSSTYSTLKTELSRIKNTMESK